MIYRSLNDERYALSGPLARKHPARRREPPPTLRDTLVYADKAITIIAATLTTTLAYCSFLTECGINQ